VRFARALAERGNVRKVALVHGEPDAKRALAEALADAGLQGVVESEPGAVVEL
jgi:hypothetical protein